LADTTVGCEISADAGANPAAAADTASKVAPMSGARVMRREK
jgi:hypothetical protein